MDGGKATRPFPAFVAEDDGHEACHDWVKGQLNRQMDRSLHSSPGFQGKVTFPNGFTLEGSFGSVSGRGLHTQGVLDTAALPPDPSSTCKR